MTAKTDYAVRVSIYGRMFEEPTEVYHPSTDSGPATLAKAWAYKLCWERDHEGCQAVAEVVHIPTGRIILDPPFLSFSQKEKTRLKITSQRCVI